MLPHTVQEVVDMVNAVLVGWDEETNLPIAEIRGPYEQERITGTREKIIIARKAMEQRAIQHFNEETK